MEFVDGDDVEKLIVKKNGLDEATTLAIVRQVASGLAHAAQHDIVHRDIKPANLLVLDPPEGFSLPPGVPMVKITDFGLAFLANDQAAQTRLTAANDAVGSPHYMSPEQISGHDIDHRADIYSLGATMYHMLAGRPLFDGKTVSQIIAQKLSGEIPSLRPGPNPISEQTAQLVDEMLELNPDARLDDYGRLTDRIDAALQAARLTLQSGFPADADAVTTIFENPPSRAEPKSAVASHGSRPIYRNRLAITVMAAVVIVVLTIGGLQLIPNSRRPTAPARDMVSSGWSEPLFNGQTLGALPSSGSWIVDEDDEGAIVIAGTNGMIRRSLFRTDSRQRRPLENYRLLLFVRLHQATAVELQFGITADRNQDGSRSVLRVMPEKVVLARRPDDRGPLLELSVPVVVKNMIDQYHVVVLEHQHGHWWIFFDEQLIGTVMPQSASTLPEIRLVVEGGPAWFSDLQVEELVAGGNPTESQDSAE